MHSRYILTDMLHLLFCTKDHVTSMLDYNKCDHTMCRYILESSMAGTWTLQDHLKWLEESDKFIFDLGVKDADSALAILTKIIKIARELREMLSKHPNIKSYLKTLDMFPE